MEQPSDVESHALAEATANFIRWQAERVAERDALLLKILNEVNHDYAHGGPSRLNEATIREIEKTLGVHLEKGGLV